MRKSSFSKHYSMFFENQHCACAVDACNSNPFFERKRSAFDLFSSLIEFLKDLKNFLMIPIFKREIWLIVSLPFEYNFTTKFQHKLFIRYVHHLGCQQ